MRIVLAKAIQEKPYKHPQERFDIGLYKLRQGFGQQGDTAARLNIWLILGSKIPGSDLFDPEQGKTITPCVYLGASKDSIVTKQLKL